MDQRKVSADELARGMYVSRLDRPWVETPFLFQGFMIENDGQISTLKEYCRYVYIDVERGSAPMARAAGSRADGARRSGEGAARPARAGSIPKPAERYEDETTVEQELEPAREARESVAEAIGTFLDNIREGRKPEITDVKRTVVEMERSILRNPDACLWLRLLKDKSSYAYAHCVDTAVLAIAFARQLGLRREQVHLVGLGALLADVGKMCIPTELLAAPRSLTDAEMSTVREHVAHSVRIVHEMPEVDRQMVELVATHHERYDGSGYPKGLVGGDIPRRAGRW